MSYYRRDDGRGPLERDTDVEVRVGNDPVVGTDERRLDGHNEVSWSFFYAGCISLRDIFLGLAFHCPMGCQTINISSHFDMMVSQKWS